ncbi:hypothetical protein Tco_0189029 [Tanacetum coccineum]
MLIPTPTGPTTPPSSARNIPSTFPPDPKAHTTAQPSINSSTSQNATISTTRTHPIVTRAQVGTIKTNPHFHDLMYSISFIPESPSIALSDPY